MRKLRWVIILAIFCSAMVSVASAEVNLKFYYPVGVAGPLVKVINDMVAEFEKQNPGVDV